MPQWEKDPTVSSMLVVLDKIHEKFIKDSGIKFEALDNITFDLFELEEFNLDEKLYIQMNSRGRQLTEFELFKSKFIEFLEEEENFKEELETIKQKIDGEWADFFWNHYNLKEKVDGEEYFSIDKPFLNFIYFITEMLGYETLEGKKADEKDDISVFYNKEKEIEELGFDKLFKLIYQDKKNVNFLINVLDKLEDIKKNNENIWGVFSRSDEGYKQNKGKVAVVSKENEKDLLKRVVLKKEDQDKGRELNFMEKVLLFLLIKCTVEKLEAEKFKDLLRVARNLLIRIRTPRSDGVSYNPTLGRKDLHSILKLFDEWIGKDIYGYLEKVDTAGTGISKASLQQEKDKAQYITQNPDLKEYIHKVEDHIYVRGYLTNLLWEGIDFNKTVSERLYKTFEKKDEEIIPVLIIAKHELENKNKDAGENENNKCPYPHCIAYNKVFFGRENYWEFLLTEKELKGLWKLFLIESKYSPENWESCRDGFLNQFSNKEKTWYYYFVKYPVVFERFKDTIYSDEFKKKDKNVFLLPSEFNSFNSPKDLSAWLCAEKMRTNEANGYHLNPFIYYVCKEVKSELLKHDVQEEDGVHYGCGIRNDFPSYIVIKREKFRIKGCDGNTPLDMQEDLVEELKEKVAEKINAES